MTQRGDVPGRRSRRRLFWALTAVLTAAALSAPHLTVFAGTGSPAITNHGGDDGSGGDDNWWCRHHDAAPDSYGTAHDGGGDDDGHDSHHNHKPCSTPTPHPTPTPTPHKTPTPTPHKTPTPTPHKTPTPTPPCACHTPTPTPLKTPTPTPHKTPTPTPSGCQCPTPTPPCNCASQTLAQDMFGRTSSGSWGNADTGGQYSDLGPTTAFNVNNGTGVFTIDAASKSLGALLNNASARDVDIRFKVLANKIAAGGNAYVYAVARRSGNNEVRPKLVLRPDGSIQVHASALVNGTEQSLGTAVTVAGLTQSTSRYIWFHAQVSGANPTTVRVKAWADGTAEPSAWQFTATTTQASCQVAGSVGLRLFVTAGVTNAPIDYRFDNYVVKTL